MHRLLLLLLALASACAASARDLPDPVILISLDAFHPSYLEGKHAPTLRALAERGVRADWMTPSFPTKTFPNHYTLVTGLRPDRHGIIHNEFTDPRLGRFALHDRAAVENGAFWGGEPLWNTARKAGLRTATMFWPGSEAPIGGQQPDHWRRFDYEVSIDARVDQVIDWLSLPAEQRPRLITLYLEHVDVAAHAHGPHAPQTDAAIAAVDAALARLLDGLRGLGMAGRLNLVITSDHGMAEVAIERTIAVDDLVDPAAVEIEHAGEVLTLRPRPGRADEVERALLGRPHPQLECWRRDSLPARWHFGQNPRVPPIVCQASEGWLVATRGKIGKWRTSMYRGAHGFAPESPSMRALFVAHGPAFRSGTTLPPFDNVHVYPLLASLLGIEPAANEGELAVLAPALKPDFVSQSASSADSAPR